MIKNQLYPYIEKYINEYLLGFSKEQLNIGLTNGTIMLQGLYIRPDTTNEKLDYFDFPIWLKVGTIKDIRIGCSLMNFLGDNPLEVEINDVDLIICPSFKNIVKNFNSFIVEKEGHFKEEYDPTDNNSHIIFGQTVNFRDSSMKMKKEEIIEIFKESFYNSHIADSFNKLYTKALKFYYHKNYLIKIRVKNISLRFEDDCFNFYGKSAIEIKAQNLELSLSVDGIMKKNNFKVENVFIYYDKNPSIVIPSKFFLSNIKEDGKLDIDKYFELVKKEKIRSDTKNSIVLLDSFNCMGNFGIKAMENEKIDFFAKNNVKKYTFFMQVATNEIQFSLYPDLIHKFQNFQDFIKSFYVNELVQYFKPMRKPYEKSSELIVKYSKDPTVLKKRKLIVRDWFYYMIWFTRVKKAVFGSYFKNKIHEEFTKFYNMMNTVNNTDAELDNARINQSNLNDSMNMKKDPIKLNKEKLKNLNPDGINLNVDYEILVKGLSLKLFSEKDFINLKINNIKNLIKVDKEKGVLVLNFKELIVIPSNKVQIDKGVDDKIYQKTDKNSVISSENTEACSYFNEEDSENPSKNNNFIIKENNKEVNKANYFSSNIPLNPKLMLLNEALDQIGGNDGSNVIVNSSNKNRNKLNNRTGNVLKEILGSIEDEDNKKMIIKEKKNKELSEIINEFNKSYHKKNSSKSFSTQVQDAKVKIGGINNGLQTNKNNDGFINKIILSNEKVGLNLCEIQGSDNTSNAFSLTFTKKIEYDQKISDSLNINIGYIRINYVHDYFIKLLHILLAYQHFYKTLMNKLKNTVKFEIDVIKEVYLIRKYILDRIEDIDNQEEIRNYAVGLRQSIQLLEDDKRKDGHFTVNFITNLLKNNIIDFYINVADILVLGFESNPLEDILSINKNTSKLKFPKLLAKLALSKEKIYSKVLDFEFQYNNTNMLATFIDDIIVVITSYYNNNLILLNPLIRKILVDYEKLEKERLRKTVKDKEKNFSQGNENISFLMNIISSNLNKNHENSNGLHKSNNNILGPKESLKTNQQSVLKNLIESNLSSNHVKKISVQSFNSMVSEAEGHFEVPIPVNEKDLKKNYLKHFNKNESDSEQVKSQVSNKN